MFENNYKNAFDNIKPDDRLKSKILSELQTLENKRQNPALPWRIGFAITAVAAIVLGIVFVPRNTVTTTAEPETLSATVSYSDIYSKIKKFKDRKYNFFYSDDENLIIEEETVYEGSDSVSSNSTIGSIKGSPTDDVKESENTSLKDKGEDYSDTTTQVEGVAEADIVKTDGEYIYYLNDNKIRVFKAAGSDSSLVCETVLPNTHSAYYGDMFLKGDRLVLMQTNWFTDDKNYVSLIIYDVSNPNNITEVTTLRQEGYYNSSRMIDNYVYLISNCDIRTDIIKYGTPETFVPTLISDYGEAKAVTADSIYCYEEVDSPSYTVIAAYDIESGKLTSNCNLLGGTDQIYCSKENIITANSRYDIEEPEGTDVTYASNRTTISRLSIANGKIEYKTSGEVPGILENQFYIDEYKGNFRFVTTVNYTTKKLTYYANTDKEIETYSSENAAALTVLDSELKKIGSIENLAKGERVYSVRFMGDIAYFVTFRQTDPLFAADLSDPTAPKILSELKIPGFSEYMYPYGDGLLLGFGMDADEKTGRTGELKLSMFNIADPANVTEDDKTIIDNYYYSQALYDHKAMLVSPTKNLIGFFASDYSDNYEYMIYQYSDKGFTKIAGIPLKSDIYGLSISDGVRGIFIENDFYIVCYNALACFDIETFTQTALVSF